MKRGINKSCYGFLSTLSNPTRIAILEMLDERGPANATKIVEALGQEQSMVSHNLTRLVRCGFIFAEKKGKERIYALNKEIVEPLLMLIGNHARKYCQKCRRIK